MLSCGSTRYSLLKMKIDFISGKFKRLFVWVAALLSIATAYGLLHSVFCFYMHGRFKLLDYGIYTNMIWNCGHGEPFKFLVDHSYLKTHLSFTLALLGPVFRVWDSPLLLMVIQWLSVCGGAIILYRTARKCSIPADMALAVMFFFLGYRFTQSALMYEFHGVILLMFLVPWLYYCCSFQKKMAFLPLILILGVREDAFLCVLPVILYFAVRDKWKVGYVLFGLTLLYGLLAVFVIYPKINGISIFERRSNYIRPDFGFTEDDIRSRLNGLVLTLLPTLVVLWRRSLPVYILTSVAYLTTLFSAYHVQQAIGSHYSPPVMAALAIGLVESLHMRQRLKLSRHTTLRAVMLVLITLGVHLYSGFVFLGGKNSEIFNRYSREGHWALRAAKFIPKDGVLLTDRQMSSYCANRRDLLCWNKWFAPEWQQFDSVFLKISMIPYENNGTFAQMLTDGRLGVTYCDGMYVVLEVGADTSLNSRILWEAEVLPVILAETEHHAGSNVTLEGGRIVRYWEGKGHRAPATISYGASRKLKPGKYQAVFRFRTARPQRVLYGSWGKFSVHRLNDQGPALAETEIMNLVIGSSLFLEQAMPFEIDADTDVEIRITGGDAQLWLDRVTFFPGDMNSSQ